MNLLPSMSKVYNLGHQNLEKLWDTLSGKIVVQEKIDGSQFSWRWDDDGTLYTRSKRTSLADETGVHETPGGLFGPSVYHLLDVDPRPGILFRGEAIAKRRHNTITYERVPDGNIVLFHVEPTDRDLEDSLDFWAEEMGIDSVPTWTAGVGYASDFDAVNLWIEDLRSVLGGPVEGVVFKNYDQFDPMTGTRPLMAKQVRQAFREKHSRQFKKDNPTAGDVINSIIEALNTEARFEKAVQHLRDAGELVGDVQDIGPLMKEVKADTLEEERDWIVEQLVNFALPKIQRKIGRGLPEWYKEKLARGEIDA